LSTGYGDLVTTSAETRYRPPKRQLAFRDRADYVE
jgi:hypothetical protein